MATETPAPPLIRLHACATAYQPVSFRVTNRRQNSAVILPGMLLAVDLLPSTMPAMDPFARRVVIGAAVALGLVILLVILGRIRRGIERRRMRVTVRRRQAAMAAEQKTLRTLAEQILATSSTDRIAGYEVVRQIEAVFTDNHNGPREAIDALKALAARKGANALLNVREQRLPSGKCAASADAVLVRQTGDQPSATSNR